MERGVTADHATLNRWVVNVILKFTDGGRTIETRQVRYLNYLLEQDHRFNKRITAPMMGFKAFHSAAATIAGIETAHMIRKGQIPANGASAFQTFAGLAAELCSEHRSDRLPENLATEPAQARLCRKFRYSFRTHKRRRSAVPRTRPRSRPPSRSRPKSADPRAASSASGPASTPDLRKVAYGPLPIPPTGRTRSRRGSGSSPKCCRSTTSCRRKGRWPRSGRRCRRACAAPAARPRSAARPMRESQPAASRPPAPRRYAPHPERPRTAGCAADATGS